MEIEADFFIQQSNCSTKCAQSQEEKSQDFLSGKMFQGHFPATINRILEPCSKKSQKPIFQCLNLVDGQMQEWLEAANVISHGESWIPNFSESPKDVKESFLSQIFQEKKDVPEKYYLSARACQGILRRAKEREKILPTDLREALERQCQM